MNNSNTCKLEECARPIKNKREQLCNAHYLQWFRGKPFTTPRQHVRYDGQTPCGFPDCANMAVAKGICSTHYAQKRNTGTMFPINTRHRAKGSTAVRDAAGNKQCARCKEWRDVESYGPHGKNPDGLRSECSPCRKAAYMANREQIRNDRRERAFNITHAEFTAMLEAQGHACAVCGTDDPGSKYWCVDHDHACCPESGRSCGKCVRAILCGRCNLVLGQVNDDAVILNRMTKYLTTHAR